jgi:hypothetical protein
MKPEEKFKEIVRKIDENYSLLQHTSQWSFLYTPQKTFYPGQKLAFIGLNPGGDDSVSYSPNASCEDGNEYLIGEWTTDKTGGQNPLQQQIQSLYKEIISQNPNHWDNHTDMMNETLAFNYVPYRSKSWKLLNNKTETTLFARKLLEEILTYIQPTVIITMDKATHDAVTHVYIGLYPNAERHQESSTIGWGKVQYRLDHYSTNDKTKTVIRLPHLSRYKIYSREACAPARKSIAKAIAETIRNSS